MFKKQIEKIKNLFSKKTDVSNKKNMENLIVFLVILVITVIVINIIWNDDKKEESNTQGKTLAKTDITQNTEVITTEQDEYNLKTELEQTLSKINGVGKVTALITYSESSQIVAMYNQNSKESTTEETDTNGGIRTINEKDTNKEVIFKEENGEKIPVTEKLIMPKIEGAIIIAEGANNAEVKSNIIQAVEVVTGLATHKIQVFEMESN